MPPLQAVSGPSAKSSEDFSQSRKRTRASISKSLAPDSEPGLIPSDETEKKQRVTTTLKGVCPPHLICPKSLYLGYEPPLPQSKERHVLKDILVGQSHEVEKCGPDFEDNDFIYADINDFAIYRPYEVLGPRSSKIADGTPQEKPRSNEFVSLHELQERFSNYFLLDAVICFEDTKGQQQRYIQAVPFDILSIGAYEDINCHSVGSQIWIQSAAGKASNVWYRLRRPATEYARYHEAFLWLADLAKHLVDFLHTHEQVKLNDFKAAFTAWLHDLHGSDNEFSLWRAKHPKNDLRQSITAYATFLWNQAGQLGSHYISHPLWTEIDPASLIAVPRQVSKRKVDNTVVTPYVYKCFSRMAWAKFLDPVPYTHRPTTDTVGTSSSVKPEHHRDDHTRTTSSEGQCQVGDIVAIPTDKISRWKGNDEYWFAYVQGCTITTYGQQKLSLIWLYRASDTVCEDLMYPYPNELFMSNHCNCPDSPIYANEVRHKVQVVLFGCPESMGSGADFFIRQTYSNADSYWLTLQERDFCCQCTQRSLHPQSEYLEGDTLLVKTICISSKEILEPMVFIDSNTDGSPNTARLRRLLQKRNGFNDPEADMNELVYTSQVEVRNISDIVRACHIRFYTPADRKAGRIPAPYNRKGAGDCYYVSWLQRASSYGVVEAIQQPWPTMKQGFEPTSSFQAPLRGLDIFCGGGNLGRGLEEAGAVRNEWAVDYFPEAIHTYHANARHSMKLFNGSVNDYLLQALDGSVRMVAQKGEVDFISAGSPCPGYSNANQDRTSERSLLNNSLVASVIAFVDFYRPQYVVMENVVGMAASSQRKREATPVNVFAQVLCALVGLGYQVRPMLLDAWNFGTPQSRTRLFVTAAAPGLAPLTQPPASHSHPDNIPNRALGKTANGLPYCEREWVATPFQYLTIGEATQGLPANPDGRVPIIGYPDHRCMRNQSFLNHVRLSCIPRFPAGMTFIKSFLAGWQPPPQIRDWHWETKLRSDIRLSKAWQRAKENALLPTVTTSNTPGEAMTGSALHWEAHRCLTVMEARRAQGIPDDEVIVGLPPMQWRIIGNAVARQVAIALGVSLREAWMANQ
ncbi:MAG: hypothetical protein LQ350_000576 [Teloschistes chrysophthalmus]|nr:MAG: hypothetical protein LQ350_000576 [Niorma chrysophthalma]